MVKLYFMLLGWYGILLYLIVFCSAYFYQIWIISSDPEQYIAI